MTFALRVEPLLQSLADRAGALLPERQVRGSGELLLFRVVLDAIELGDQIERLLRDRRSLERIEEVPPRMRVARRAFSTRDVLDVVVAAVPVDEEDTLGAFEQRLRRRA